jgi:hypothetical protein
MKKLILTFAAALLACMPSFSQCAMCRAVLENNISNGNTGIAAGINFGILYLFLAPYTFVAILAYLWYRTSRNNARKQFNQGPISG